MVIMGSLYFLYIFIYFFCIMQVNVGHSWVQIKSLLLLQAFIIIWRRPTLHTWMISHDLQQDGFSQSWLVEIFPVNLCKLLSNLLWVNSFSYDQIVCSLGEPFHTKQPDYFISRMIISLLFEPFRNSSLDHFAFCLCYLKRFYLLVVLILHGQD